MPCKLERNEDGEYNYSVRQPMPKEEWPKYVWCWDCEEIAQHVFGEPCPAEVDHRGFNDNAWEGIP